MSNNYVKWSPEQLNTLIALYIEPQQCESEPLSIVEDDSDRYYVRSLGFKRGFSPFHDGHRKLGIPRTKLTTNRPSFRRRF